jgi:hypothetical protein
MDIVDELLMLMMLLELRTREGVSIVRPNGTSSFLAFVMRRIDGPSVALVALYHLELDDAEELAVSIIVLPLQCQSGADLRLAAIPRKPSLHNSHRPLHHLVPSRWQMLLNEGSLPLRNSAKPENLFGDKLYQCKGVCEDDHSAGRSRFDLLCEPLR